MNTQALAIEVQEDTDSLSTVSWGGGGGGARGGKRLLFTNAITKAFCFFNLLSYQKEKKKYFFKKEKKRGKSLPTCLEKKKKGPKMANQKTKNNLLLSHFPKKIKIDIILLVAKHF